MSDKIFLKDITLPIIETGENETYSFVQTDSDLETAGDAADAKKVGDEITELKADLTAVETDIETGDLTAGTAKQLLSDNGMTDKSPYLFRAMPTNADREEPKIVGGSVVWNQLQKSPSEGGTYQYQSSGSISYDGDTVINTATSANVIDIKNRERITFRKDHKYVFSYDVKCSESVPVKAYFKYNLKSTIALTANTWTRHSIVTAWNTDDESTFWDVTTNSAVQIGSTLQIKNVVLTDLTAMFTTAVADYAYTLELATAWSGIAWLKKYGYFTKKYYPFCEPTFKHVEGLVSHKMVGFNQWNEVWEAGGINNSAEDESGSNRIRSKNYIHVVPGAQYYVNFTDTGFAFYPKFYDSDKNYVGLLPYFTHPSIITVPNNACYLRFFVYKSNWSAGYGTDLLININLSDPAKNGTYEPYKSYIYPLDTDVVLRGIPKLDASNNLYFDGDVYKADGTVSRRYGILDLGDLSWSSTGSGDTRFFYASITSYGFKSVQNNLLILTKYPVIPIGSSGTDQGIGFASLDQIRLRDNSYSDAAALKAGVAGQKVLYQKATPTTETADPYAPLQLADPYGTEEWVLDDEAFPMPVGQETFYPENLRAKIEGLPWNFANLIAPTEVSNVATRNYTAGNLLIVDNVLYKVTVNIANGGAIAPGTNVTATTLAEIISALQ